MDIIKDTINAGSDVTDQDPNADAQRQGQSERQQQGSSSSTTAAGGVSEAFGGIRNTLSSAVGLQGDGAGEGKDSAPLSSKDDDSASAPVGGKAVEQAHDEQISGFLRDQYKSAAQPGGRGSHSWSMLAGNGDVEFFGEEVGDGHGIVTMRCYANVSNPTGQISGPDIAAKRRPVI